MERKYSDSYEYTRDLIRAAVNETFKDETGYSPYDLKATYPEDGIAILMNWSENKFYEVSYTIEGETVTLGELQETEHDESFISAEQINNSMKQGQPFILLNSETENPVYRVLVQTPDELPAHDMGFDSIQYDTDGIKNAMEGLLGEYVYDKTQSNHGRMREGSAPEKKFAQVVNTGYCPSYGGYTDLEIFDKDYVPIIEQALNSRNKGLPVKEGPSTEIKPIAGEKFGDNSLKMTDWKYNGLVWDKNPRDKSTGVCNVVLNSIPENIKGDGNLTEEVVNIKKDEYDALQQAKADYEALKPKHEQLKEDYQKGETLYNTGKTKYTELKEEEGKLREQLIPIWTREGEVKEQMVNSIMDKVPEAEREAKRKDFEEMSIPQLENVMILNSLEVPTGAGGVIEGTTPPTQPTGKQFDDPVKQKQWEDAQKISAKQSRGVVSKVKQEDE